MELKKNIIVAVALTSGIFIVDINTPLGYAEWLLYVIPLLIAAPALSRLSMLLFSAADTILLASGFFLSPAGGGIMRAILNRLMGALAIWTMAFLINRRKQADESLEQYYREQEQRVDERTAELKKANAELQNEIDERMRTEGALARSKAEFEAIFDSMTDAVIFVDTQRRILFTNPAFTTQFGYTQEEVKGRVTQFLYYNPGDYEEQGRLRYHTGEKTERKMLRVQYHRKDGTAFWSDTAGLQVRDGYGNIFGFAAISRDVTEQKRAEEALRDSEERFRKLFEEGPLGIAIAGLDFRFIRVNGKFCELLGYGEEELLGRTFAEITHPEDIDKDVGMAEQLRKGAIPSFVMEKRYIRKDGTAIWVNLTGSIIRSEKKEPLYFVAMIEDITARKWMEEEMRHMAHHDPLTGLPNRRFFVDIAHIELAQAQRNKKKAAILFLDLDRFKEINDVLGHETGDALLKETAGRLRSQMRQSDTIARIGGDEFNILLGDMLNAEDSVVIAEKIMDTLRSPYAIAGHEFQITASIGISLYPDDATGLDTLLRYADIALYYAKEQGRNKFQFYNPAINVRSVERMRLQNSLQQTLERGELVVYYQPQLDIRTGRIVNAEALVRWRHPELGLLEPKQFLPSAEETGFITEIDKWVLRTACSQIKSWLDAGLTSVGATVNLSARHFQETELVKKISKILEEAGLRPEYLDVEITETVAMSNIDRTIARLNELVALGVHVSIDDFGTGYSSLNYLKRLPIQKLKIDQSFIRDIATDADDRAIISAVTAMAHNMKIRVLAEGVETGEQMDFVRSAECDEVQGFAVSRPLSSKAFEDFMKRNNGYRSVPA